MSVKRVPDNRGDVGASAVYTRTTGDYTIASGTFADIDSTNLALSITTGARRVRVGFTGVVQSSVAGDVVNIDLLLDGTTVSSGTSGVVGAWLPSTTNRRANLSFTWLSDVLSAGSHTFKLQWRRAVGSGTLTMFGGASDENPAQFYVIEETTASAVSGSSYVYKTGDETVTNSTTLQDDDHLTLAIGANETWMFRYWLFASNAANTADIKLLVVGPSGATTVRYMWTGPATGATGVETTLRTQGLDNGTAIPVGVYNVSTLGYAPITGFCYVVNSSNAGNVKLQWAQNTTDATNGTTLKAGSFLQAERIA